MVARREPALRDASATTYNPFVSAPPWFETFFGPDYFEIYRDFLTPERTASEVDGAIRLLGIAPGARVLDLACGHGRHAIPLAERGFLVTGYDLSETFLERARGEAKARGVYVRWRQGDMRELPFHAEFDAVINLFTSFGYFADEADDLAALRRVRAALVPSGRFLVETLHREGLEPRFQPHIEYTTSKGTQVQRDYNWDLAHDVMKDRVRLIRPDGTKAEYETAFRLRTRAAWVSLLERAGFEDIRVTGGLDGSELTPSSRRLALVCTSAPAAP